MVNIPRLYRSKTIEIQVEPESDPISIEVRGYRPIDIEYAAKLQSLRNELPTLFNRLKVFRDLQNKLIKQAKKRTAENPISPDELESQFMDNVMKIEDSDYTEEELRELEDAKARVDEIQAEIEYNASILGQRGLKRYFFQDEPEYQEAESRNKLTDYIDSIPDIEIDQDNLLKVAYAMVELSAPNEKLQKRLERKAADKGKPVFRNR